MPVKFKSEYRRAYDRSHEHPQEESDNRARDTCVLRAREPGFTRKRRVATHPRDRPADEGNVAATKEQETRRNERSRRDVRPQPTWPASEYQLQYSWKDPVPTESPLLVADHTLFSQTRNISGATQKDVIPRLSEYKSQFIDHLKQPSNEILRQPPAVTEKDGPSVTTPRGIERNEEVVSQPIQLEEVRPPREKRGVRRERPALSQLELPKRRRRRPRSTYRSNYKSPMKFLYQEGAYVLPPKQEHDPDSISSWFDQVLELRQLAQQYEQRSRGTHFSRDHLIEMECNEDTATTDSRSDGSSTSLPRHSQPIASKSRLPYSDETHDRPPERRGPRMSHGKVEGRKQEQRQPDVDKQLFVRQPLPLPPTRQRHFNDAELEIEEIDSSEDEDEMKRGTTIPQQSTMRPATAGQFLRPIATQTQPVTSQTTHTKQSMNNDHQEKKWSENLEIPSDAIARHRQLRTHDPLIGQSSVNMGRRHSFQSHTVPIVRDVGQRVAPTAHGMTPVTPEKDPLIGHTGGFGPRHSFQSQKIPILKPGEEWGDIKGQTLDFRRQGRPRLGGHEEQLRFSDRKPHCTCGAEDGGKQVDGDDDGMSDTASVVSDSQSIASETLERARKRQHFWS